MKKRAIFFKAVLLAAMIGIVTLPAMALALETNVAFGKAVTLSGTSGAAGSTLVDGTFLNRGTGWTNGTVYWHGTSPYAEIDLGGTYTLTGFVVQADDNDAYLLKYYDPTDSGWKVAWNVPNYDAYGSGMQTRPDPGNNTVRQPVSPITASMLRLYAASGDNSYSVSEIQAYGAPVPLPAGLMLFAPGLAGLALLRKRIHP